MSMIGFEAVDGESSMKIHLDSRPGKSWVQVRESYERGTMNIPLSDRQAELLAENLRRVHAAILPLITASRNE